MFALAAAVVALLAILEAVDSNKLMWWWLMFIALHFFYPWGPPLPGPRWGRRADGS